MKIENGFPVPPASASLDPADWDAFRGVAHHMLDDILTHLATLRQQPVWQPAPDSAKARIRTALPEEGEDLAQVYATFKTAILPYGSGNIHPGFMGWVQGGGTPAGVLGEMLAAGMNGNLGGRDHMPIEVERQILHWMRQVFRFPETAGGQFLTGASQANFVALLVARTRVLGAAVRRAGLRSMPELTGYGSVETHGCVARAFEMSGLGAEAFRQIPADAEGEIDLDALVVRIEADIAAGRRPFLLVGTAGTVNTGAVDDLDALADIAARYGMHFHVDGALGALAVLDPVLGVALKGLERADSLAFDFHKWGQVPYDAGYLLVRDEAWQKDTFASPAAYLTRAETGLAGGDWWPCDTGPDLSRGFRALKTWFTLKTSGLDAIGRAVAGSCALARLLAERVRAEPRLAALAPTRLNVVCFGYAGEDQKAPAEINRRIVEALHLEGRVAPSLTLITGQPAIRACLINHRTTAADIDALIDRVLAIGDHLYADGQIYPKGQAYPRGQAYSRGERA